MKKRKKLFSVVRASVPDSLDKDSKTFLSGDFAAVLLSSFRPCLGPGFPRLLRLRFGRFLRSNFDEDFESRGIVCEVRLVSSSFFDKAFCGGGCRMIGPVFQPVRSLSASPIFAEFYGAYSAWKFFPPASFNGRFRGGPLVAFPRVIGPL